MGVLVMPLEIAKEKIIQRRNDPQNREKTRVENILKELGSSKDMIESDDVLTEGTHDIEESFSKDSPIIIKGFGAILMGAINARATDIHIEPFENNLRIRYRLDGNLKEIKTMGKAILNALVSRIKILSNLDISERRLPQDGRMKMKILGRDIDFRIAIMPTIYGEKVVIRVLDKTMVDMDIEKIGFLPNEYNKVVKNLSVPHGIILITGPTGSGKSTTLYAFLNYLNNADVNILTVEDPVEYNIEGINQVQAKPEIGLTFAASLREFLRQDPDIIMVGEMRDSETAEIAIKAALTGHLVFSTLHTNDAPSSIFRLMNMGVEPYLISASIQMVLSQRLVRKLCPQCKIIDVEAPLKLANLGFKPGNYEGSKFYTSSKTECEFCNSTGYKGRMAIHEILVMSDELRELVERRAPLKEIAELARIEGMLSLKENALVKVMEGLTSLDEILKTCQ